MLELAKGLVGSSDWYQYQWEHLQPLMDKKWLILWGTKDEFITTVYLDKWKERLPHATVKELDGGHFVQEEQMEEAILAIGDFMKS